MVVLSREFLRLPASWSVGRHPPTPTPLALWGSLVLQGVGHRLHLPSAQRASRRPGGSWRPGSQHE